MLGVTVTGVKVDLAASEHAGEYGLQGMSGESSKMLGTNQRSSFMLKSKSRPCR